MLTASRARELLSYDPETGLLHWNVWCQNAVQRGAVAGHYSKSRKHGYVQIKVDRKIYQAHRVIWLLMTGEWPRDLIDHINRNRSDNRWANLRAATYSQNRINSRPSTRSAYDKAAHALFAAFARPS